MTTPANLPTDSNDSPPWSRTVKITVGVVAIIALVAALFTFRGLIRQLLLAAILSYVLNPIIKLFDERTPLKRSHSILVVYLLFFTVLGVGSILLGVTAYTQVDDLVRAFPELVRNTAATLASLSEQTFAIGPWSVQVPRFDLVSIDWQGLAQDLIGFAQPVLSRSTTVLRAVLTGTIGTVATFLFVLVLSIYITIDFPRLGNMVADVAQVPGYRKDAERLTRDFGRIWGAYLRGQIILGLVIGFAVWFSLWILGVENAVALGILSGVLEFLPIIGPVIGGGAAIIVALFQTSPALFGLATWQLALAVLGVMLVVQQLENNILVPRIVGDSLDLHPLVVMVGVIMGSTVAGILGAVLAAPILATIKLLGMYAWRKMFDLPPFPKPEPDETEENQSFFGRMRQRLLSAVAQESSAPQPQERAQPQTDTEGDVVAQPAILREQQPQGNAPIE